MYCHTVSVLSSIRSTQLVLSKKAPTVTSLVHLEARHGTVAYYSVVYASNLFLTFDALAIVVFKKKLACTEVLFQLVR